VSASGILNVNKDTGRSSFGVVSLVKRAVARAPDAQPRRAAGERRPRVGHAGALDPLASGVLLVCVGQAVRITEYLMDLPKTYRTTIRLGIATDTYDAEGEPTSVVEKVEVKEGQARDVLERFTGEIEQIPPAFSAVKVGGKPAYRLARKGQQPELKPRKATVYRLDLLRLEPPELEIEVECSRGTYVRTLAQDIGQELGCGGHVASLVRTRVGPFTVESAIEVEELEAAIADGSWQELLQPMDCGLLHLPQVTVHIEDEKDIRHGQPVRLDPAVTASVPSPEPGTEARAYAEDGSLVAIIRYDGRAGLWRPKRVFAAESG
jgi:tRNA pseudouridine55 synthase